MNKNNHLPPEITGKYRKVRASRIQETPNRLSFAIYRDKGKNRLPLVNDDYSISPSLAPVVEVRTSSDIEPDIKNDNVLLLWPEIGPEPSPINHSVEGYIYHRETVTDRRPSIIITQLSLFSGPQDHRVTVPVNMVKRLMEFYYQPLTFAEQVRSYSDGVVPPVYSALPIVQIADCRYTNITDYRFVGKEGDSFRDNLR